MIIVSQDKSKIINFENLEVIGIGNSLENDDGNFQILIETTSDNEMTIGEYKTEERAKEVLQEIIKGYKFYNGKTYYVEDVHNLLGDYENGVYEMPKG